MPTGPLKIFISWSGEKSRAVAEALDEYLPYFLPGVEPWVSAEDIDKGAKWSQVISGELHKTNFAILCLTPENLTAPWLLFEAGALSKHSDSRVCTYLLGINSTDVKDPLSQFQHTKADREETLELLESINKGLGEASIEPRRLEKSFSKWWPEFEDRLRSIMAGGSSSTRRVDPAEKVPAMVTEILEHSREQTRVLQEILALVGKLASPPAGDGAAEVPESAAGLNPVVTRLKLPALKPGEQRKKT